MSIQPSPFRVALRDLPAHRRIVVTPAYVDGLVRGMPLRDALDQAPEDDGGVAELELEPSEGDSISVQGTITGQVTVACSRCVTAVPIRFDEQVRVTFLPATQVPSDDSPDPRDGKASEPKTAATDGATGATGGTGLDGKSGTHGKPGFHGKGGAHGRPDGKAPPHDKPDGKVDDRPGAKAGGHGKDLADDDDGVELETDDLDVFPYGGGVIDLEPLIREQFVLIIPFAPLCKDDCLGLCAQCGTDKNVAPCECGQPIDPRFAALQGLKLPS